MRAARLVPYLLVAALLAWIAVRHAARPARASSRSQVASLLRAGNAEAAAAALEGHVARYGDAREAWFAAEMWMRLGQAERGLAAAYAAAGDRPDPAGIAALASAALMDVGFVDQDFDRPTQFGPAVLVALVEGGNAAARERFVRAFSEGEVPDLVLFHSCMRDAGRGPMDLAVETMRRQPDSEPRRVLSANALARPGRREVHPGALETLEEVLASDRWRLENANVWQVSCIALGATGRPEAKARLEALLREREASEATPLEARERDFLLIALVAAGDLGRLADLRPRLIGEAAQQRFLAPWLIEALVHRSRLGDQEALHALGDVWMDLGPSQNVLRQRIAFALLLEDEPLEGLERVPAERMVEDLGVPDAPPRAQAIALAARLRAGESMWGPIVDRWTAWMAPPPGPLDPAEAERRHLQHRAGVLVLMRELLLWAARGAP